MLDISKSDNTEDDVIVGHDRSATPDANNQQFADARKRVEESQKKSADDLAKTRLPKSSMPKATATSEKTDETPTKVDAQASENKAEQQDPPTACTMPVHPAAEVFPMMPDADLQKMADDIRDRGLQHPIVTTRGVVIDGRNRLKACAMAGVQPTYKALDDLPEDQIIGHIIALNITRRHLDMAQRQNIAARLVSMKPGNAKAQRGSDPASCGVSVSEAARLLDVPVAGVERMRSVQKSNPEIARMVDDGVAVNNKKLTSSGALKLARATTKKTESGKITQGDEKIVPAKKPPTPTESRLPAVQDDNEEDKIVEQTDTETDLDSLLMRISAFTCAWVELRDRLEAINDTKVTNALHNMLKMLSSKHMIDSSALEEAVQRVFTKSGHAAEE